VSPSFSTRPARAEDLPLLGPLELRAAERFRSTLHPYACNLPEFAPHELGRLQRAGTVWVAVNPNDEPIGLAIAGRLGPNAYLHELDVEPSWARRGVGRALIVTVARWAKGCGDTDLVLSTFRDVPWNAPYYVRLGFVEVSEAEYTASMRSLREDEAKIMRIASRVVLRAPLERLLALG
jgi:GNAT superfamily N-acetyltransferase